MEELLPPRLVLVLQVAMMVIPQIAVLVVTRAVRQVIEMLTPGRS